MDITADDVMDVELEVTDFFDSWDFDVLKMWELEVGICHSK